MYCPECGKEIQEKINFCPYCSAKLDEYEPENKDCKGVNVENNNQPSNKIQNNKKILIVVIVALSVILIALIGILVMLLKGNSKKAESIVETTVVITTTEGTAEETTIEETTTEALTTEAATTEKVTKKQTQNNGNVESIVQIIRENYYGIQNNLSDFVKVDTGGSYQRWDDKNGTLRKIVLPPDEAEFRTMTNEYYYDENGMFQFAFLYDSNGNEYRYYFYEGMVYRYIDAAGNTTDYENGEDPYITEDIGTVYSNGEREKHF